MVGINNSGYCLQKAGRSLPLGKGPFVVPKNPAEIKRLIKKIDQKDPCNPRYVKPLVSAAKRIRRSDPKLFVEILKCLLRMDKRGVKLSVGKIRSLYNYPTIKLSTKVPTPRDILMLIRGLASLTLAMRRSFIEITFSKSNTKTTNTLTLDGVVRRARITTESAQLIHKYQNGKRIPQIIVLPQGFKLSIFYVVASSALKDKLACKNSLFKQKWQKIAGPVYGKVARDGEWIDAKRDEFDPAHGCVTAEACSSFESDVNNTFLRTKHNPASFTKQTDPRFKGKMALLREFGFI